MVGLVLIQARTLRMPLLVGWLYFALSSHRLMLGVMIKGPFLLAPSKRAPSERASSEFTWILPDFTRILLEFYLNFHILLDFFFFPCALWEGAR